MSKIEKLKRRIDASVRNGDDVTGLRKQLILLVDKKNSFLTVRTEPYDKNLFNAKTQTIGETMSSAANKFIKSFNTSPIKTMNALEMVIKSEKK